MMPQVFSFRIHKILPDSRQECNPDGNHEVDSELIEEWTNQIIELDLDEDLYLDSPDEVSLSSIAGFFFEQWTEETNWLFHLLEVEIPTALRHLLSEDIRMNQKEEKWFFPGMFCPRHQVVRFV